VNDSYGHRVGDELLQEVARRLRGCLSRTDTIARMGGDEFAIIATHLKQVDVVTTVAAEIISEISKPFSLKSRRIQTSASVGVALYNRDDRKLPEELVHMADMALYKAKEVRRGSFRYFDKALHDEERRRLFLKREMEDMVLEQELHLVFQPKIDSRTGLMAGCEALLRWQNPKTGYVAPSEFIPIAEASGHILPISEWVVDAACKELKRWSNTGLQGVSIAVNIAPIMLQSTNLFEMIRAKLEKYELAPGLLEIEITETSAFINLEQAVEQLQSLRDLGVRIAIDDFGTGYSSLDIATTLPADMLKLDGRFVRGATQRRSDAAAAIATITLAHCLGMLVVGEWVETEEQREFLARNECDQLQGYLFAKPMSADHLMAWYQDDERRRSKAA
jgi:diguanylate cyclase (GGDEF)-like protein